MITARNRDAGGGSGAAATEIGDVVMAADRAVAGMNQGSGKDTR
jgi:hypothetical protein